MQTTTVKNPPVAAADPSKVSAAKQEAQLRKAAEQFESLFVNMLMKNMRSTVMKSDLIDDGGGIETYRSLLDEEMSKTVAAGPNGMGIADMIIQRFLPDIHGNRPERPAADRAPEFQPVPRQSVRRALAAYGAGAEGRIVPRNDSGLTEKARNLGVAAADTLERYGDTISAAAAETGLDRELILAVILQESSGRPDAESRTGARGLMQLMPGTAAELGVEDPFDPVENIRGGARYLARLKERFGDDLELVLAGYNAGPGRVERAGHRVPEIAETQHYVMNVGGMYDALKNGPFGTLSEETP